MNPDPSASVIPDDTRDAGRYRRLLDSIDQGFCVIEVLLDESGRPADYRFLETNPAFARHSGLTDVEGRRMRELVPDHEEHWFECYGRVALTGEPAHFVAEARAIEHRWYDVHAFRIDEPPLRRVGVLFRDIGERMHAERSARLLAEISQNLLHLGREEEIAPLIGPKISAHFRANFCGFAELRGETSPARLGHSWHRADALQAATDIGERLAATDVWQEARAGRLVSIEDVRGDRRVGDQASLLAAGIGSLLVLPLVRDGEWRLAFVLLRPGPSVWTAGEIELARELASRCWTRVERLRADVERRATEDRLRLVLENARDYAIFTFDLDRRVTGWNSGAERLLGYVASEVIGQSADAIFVPEDRATGAAAREAAIALRDGRAANERWHLRKDGTRFWGSGVVMAMRDDRGTVCGLLKIMRDQTEEQATKQVLEASHRELAEALTATEQARAEAVAAGRAKDQFLATLSHELRTPLTPVLMVAAEGAANPALSLATRDDFELVRRNIELEARLIDDMLDITRIIQGKLALQRVPVDIHDTIRHALETTGAAAAARAIVPTVELRARHCRVSGDPARLQQILINLVGNAIKFTPPGGAVTVSTDADEPRGEIVIRITDTGIGLSPEELARIFQPFAQGSHAGETGSPVYGGLGLGLAIVEELTVRHGGRVSASSPGPGQGATFQVVLPLMTDPPEAGADGSRATMPEPGPHCRILLVEDHGNTRTVLARVLERRGHRVVAVGTRAAALDACRQETFDVLVSDLGLPDGDGCGLFRELRELQPELAGIAVSGFGMAGDLRRSAEAGFAAHLVKPVTVAKVEAVLAQLRPGGG